MKALTWLGPKQMELRDTPEPSPGPDDLLIRVAAVGICGSEIEGYLGESSIREPPQIFGHEFTGIVVEAGANTRRLTPGTRVVINPLISCYSCPMCRRNEPNLCVNRELIGAQHPGAMADFVVVPEANAFEVPDRITDIEASLVEPLAVTIRGAELASPSLLDRAVIVGAGNLGLLLLQVLLATGIGEVLVLDTHPDRRATASALGAKWVTDPLLEAPEELLMTLGGLGADTVFDCVGKSATRKLAHALTRPGGRIVLLGLHDTFSELDCNAVVRWEVSIAGSYVYSSGDFHKALDALTRGLIDIKDWLAVRPLAEGDLSFEELVANPSVVSKFVLTP